MINAGIKRATKKEAFDIVRDALLTGDAMTSNQLQALLLYFAPPVPARPKTPEQWVAKAVGVKDARTWVNYLQSDGRYLYGTDGHRVHRCATDLPAGAYCPKTMLPVTGDDAAAPSVMVERLRGWFNEPNAQTHGAIASTDCERDVIDGKHPLHVSQLPDSDVWVQSEYLDQAAPEWLGVLGPTDRVHGGNGFGDFIIMPIRP